MTLEEYKSRPFKTNGEGEELTISDVMKNKMPLINLG